MVEDSSTSSITKPLPVKNHVTQCADTTTPSSPPNPNTGLKPYENNHYIPVHSRSSSETKPSSQELEKSSVMGGTTVKPGTDSPPLINDNNNEPAYDPKENGKGNDERGTGTPVEHYSPASKGEAEKEIAEETLVPSQGNDDEARKSAPISITTTTTDGTDRDNHISSIHSSISTQVPDTNHSKEEMIMAVKSSVPTNQFKEEQRSPKLSEESSSVHQYSNHTSGNSDHHHITSNQHVDIKPKIETLIAVAEQARAAQQNQNQSLPPPSTFLNSSGRGVIHHSSQQLVMGPSQEKGKFDKVVDNSLSI